MVFINYVKYFNDLMDGFKWSVGFLASVPQIWYCNYYI